MSSTTPSSPPRAGSYILVSSSTPLEDAFTTQEEAEAEHRIRPRLFFLLPLVAFLDIALTVTLGVLVLRQEAQRHGIGTTLLFRGDQPSRDPIMTTSGASATTPPSPADPNLDDAAWERRKIVIAVVAFSIARACAYAIIGISKRIRQLGVTVAAISILSTLVYVSIANLLFQARPKPDSLDPLLSISWSSLVFRQNWRWPDAFRHVQPTMPALVGAQMAFTLFEWVLYIAVVGVKIPPGGNPVEAKRWARGLANDPDYQRGVDAASLYPSEDGEAEHDEDGHSLAQSAQDFKDPDAPRGAGADLEQARALLASPISNLSKKGDQGNDASERPLLGAGPTTPRGYGSTLTTTTPRTPQGSSYAAQSGSVRSARSPAAGRTTQGMSRSTSARSGVYSCSPNAAELGQVIQDDDDDDESEDEQGDEEDAEGSDPDDIIDITPNRAVARKEARLRLARAALPERRASGGTLSTLNIFGTEAITGSASKSNSGSTGVANSAGGGRGANVFSDEAGSPLGRNAKDQTPPALLSIAATSPEVPRRPAEASRHSSLSLLPSSSSTRTASTKGSDKERKFKLPKWMKPNKKK